MDTPPTQPPPSLTKSEKRLFFSNVGLLSFAWFMGYTANFMHFTIIVVLSLELLGSNALSTLPAGLVPIGSIFSTVPLSVMGHKFGFKKQFFVGALIGAAGAALCVVAMYTRSFALICIGLFLHGVAHASTNLLRFAAKTISPPQYGAKALSLTVAGAALAAVLGGMVAKKCVWLVPRAKYAGIYLVMLGFWTLMLLAILAIRFPPKPNLSAQKSDDEEISIHEINVSDETARDKDDQTEIEEVASTKQDLKRKSTFRGYLHSPAYLMALLAGSVSYGAMVLIMSPAPLAMLDNGHTYDDQANMLMAHLLAMFTPSLMTGFVIDAIGIDTVIGLGFVVLMSGGGILFIGTRLWTFFIGEVLVGFGWNFAYIASSTSVAKLCPPSDLPLMQGVFDTAIAMISATVTLGSGSLYGWIGWSPVVGVGLVGSAVVVVTMVGVKWRARARG